MNYRLTPADAHGPCLTVPDRDHRWSSARSRFELTTAPGVSSQQCGCTVGPDGVVALDRQPAHAVTAVTAVEQSTQCLSVLFQTRAGNRVLSTVEARYRDPIAGDRLTDARPACWILEPAVDRETRERLRRGARVDQLSVLVPDPDDRGYPPGTVHEVAGRILEVLDSHAQAVADADAKLLDVLDNVRRASGIKVDTGAGDLGHLDPDDLEQGTCTCEPDRDTDEYGHEPDCPWYEA